MKCARCGRELKHPIWIELARVRQPYGATCAKKQLQLPMFRLPDDFYKKGYLYKKLPKLSLKV